MSYAYTFLQTCLIEFPFYYFFLRTRWTAPQSAVAVLALNALTHPIVFFGFMTLKINLFTDISLAEPFAFLIEAFAVYYFLGLSRTRAALASTFANLASWQLGSLITYLLFIKNGGFL